jgi:CheY-like chemotaxis protein
MIVNAKEVLIIDDNQTVRDSLMKVLESEGFIVNSCASGSSALDLAKEKRFGAYLVDYHMPGMKGDAVTAELRKLHPDAFIVGFSLENKEQAFLAAGANKFINKDRLDEGLIQLIKEIRN